MTIPRPDHPLAAAFRDFVKAKDFPCVGAKAALSRGLMRIVVARDMRSAWNDIEIAQALLTIADDYRRDSKLFQTLVILFEADSVADEEAFEALLWERLGSLSAKDDWLGQPPDPRVSSDPDDPHFALSFGGAGFFVVGLHPRASRPARRFERPAMVFNIHDQFERLREDEIYDTMRETIIARDVALAGSPNPMLARHGETSSARQYSGRAVEEDWVCPFAGRTGETSDAA